MIKSKPVSKIKTERYFEAKGGRKTAAAMARIYNRKGGITINDKPYLEYFSSPGNQLAVRASFEVLSVGDKLSASVKVKGGGLNAQAEAARNALAKALVKLNPVYKSKLRVAGFLTRDARMVERKKYGLKKARRAPQWAKR
jgi:small subunit ribosomal protein S9